jgi:hypothetical protein
MIMPARRPGRGLTLVETLVTLLLVALAFALISRLFRLQTSVLAHQEQAERFLVDGEQFLRQVGLTFATAYQVFPTSGSSVMAVHHFSDSRLFPTGPTFNGIPFALPDGVLADPGLPIPVRTEYRLDQDSLMQDVAVGQPLAPLPSTVALSGLNTAVCEVSGPRVELKLSFFGASRVDVLRRVFYVPGVGL